MKRKQTIFHAHTQTTTTCLPPCPRSRGVVIEVAVDNKGGAKPCGSCSLVLILVPEMESISQQPIAAAAQDGALALTSGAFIGKKKQKGEEFIKMQADQFYC